MRIFFSGIGGSGIGPLALIARQAGFEVIGSDKQESNYTRALQKQGIRLYIGQTKEGIAAEHSARPIDLLVYSSSLAFENARHPELEFAADTGIKACKRDELLNIVIAERGLKLVGVAGTHGKSTTTAMIIWLLCKLGVPIGHSVGAKIGFAPMGRLEPDAEYFVYECDEFDRNFLAFRPELAVVTGIGWDHHEIYPTFEDYQKAFREFLGQSRNAIVWSEDAGVAAGLTEDAVELAMSADMEAAGIELPGEYNRRDAWLAVLATGRMTGRPLSELVELVNEFPGLKQRMELLAPGLYTNYAHTPEKIEGGMSAARQLARHGRRIVVIYEPLTNRRQYFIREQYAGCFLDASFIYWVPTYLAREDAAQAVLTPEELIPYLGRPGLAEPAELNETLRAKVARHLADGDMVVAMGASGRGSLDEWLRANFAV